MENDYNTRIEKFDKVNKLLQNIFDVYLDLDENTKDKLRTEILIYFFEHNKELQADEWEVAGCLFPEISFINLMSYFPEHIDLKIDLLDRLNNILQLNNDKNIRR